MSVREALDTLLDKRDLEPAVARAALEEIVAGETGAESVAALLVALRMKGETADEVAAFAQTMRDHALAVSPTRTGMVDTCGTGGDGTGTVNLSTLAAIIVAGADIPVAKHGNVSISSKCGSADVLKELQITVEMTPEQVARSIDEAGIGFMFAPAFHPAMKHVMPVRRALGIRTVFNILGPLTNPARPAFQLVGAPHPALADLVAGGLARMGLERAIVVHSAGADELTLDGESLMLVVEDGRVQSQTVSPEAVGLERAPLSALAGGTPPENAARLEAVIGGERGPVRDAAVLNAGAAFVATAAATDMQDGVELAAATLDNGGAAAALERWRGFCRAL